MSQPQAPNNLDYTQRKVLATIAANETDIFKQLVAQLEGGVNFVDENGMTPLQHACCKGNTAAVRLLLDMGADVNFHNHGANYTPLHFAALSGRKDVCRLLLDAGIDASSVNSVNRTAAQMAAFVGNYTCVETINNYVPVALVECCVRPENPSEHALLPLALLDAFHKFVLEINLHPVRIVLNLQALCLLKQIPSLRKALWLLRDDEMRRKPGTNELLALKFHYLGWMISEVLRCEESSKVQRRDMSSENYVEEGKTDFIDIFIKRVLKENKFGQLDYVEFTVRDCIREYPFRESIVFRQVIAQLASKEMPQALFVLRNAINGYRGFTVDMTYCSTCGTEKPDKKCSKCKAVQYCDRECQRLHWFMHKKTCTRPNTSGLTSYGLAGAPAAKESIDETELREELGRLAAS